MIDRFVMWMAWKLPRRLVYWAAVRAVAGTSRHPSCAKLEMGAIPAQAVVQLWGIGEGEL